MSEVKNYQTKKEGIATLKTVLNDANTLLRNLGHTDERIEEKLSEQFALFGVMNPKESLLLGHLDNKARKTKLTESEKATREELRAKAEVIRERFRNNCELATIKDELAKRGFIPRLRLQQKKNYKGEFTNATLIPPLWFFQKFEYELPTSIIGLQWTEFNLPVTNEPAMKVGILSICYNHVSNQYELHNWMTTYVLDTQITVDDIADMIGNPELDLM